MALSQSQKVDFLLKKIGYTASKTGFSQDGGLGASKKAGFAEPIPSPLKIADSSVWSESENIPGTPPTSTSTYVGVYTGANAIRMTVDTTVANERAFVARSTWSNQSSANMQNWIDTQYGTDYIVKVWMGNPTGVSTALPAGGGTLGSNNTWFFDYASGVLAFHDTNAPTGISTDNIYIEGYRYVGATGVPSPGDDFSFQDLTVTRNLSVTGLSTFTGLVDINGGGQANTFKVEDLTDNRIVIAGTGGELEDSANLTFNGTVLALTGNQTVSGTIDVDGQAIFDDITVSAASTFTGISTFSSNIFVEATTDTNQLHVSGVSTFNSDVKFANQNIDNALNWGKVSDILQARDGTKITFGNTNDLEITHSNDISLIRDTRTGVGGTLAVGADHLILRNKDGNEKYFEAFDNGKVSLFYDFLPKLETSGIGVTISSQLDTTNLKVSGVSTFTGNIDANGNLDVDGTTELDGLNVDGSTTLDATTIDGLLDINAGGQANTFKVEDLTSGRVVLAGTGGELEDSGNLTFNGSTLAVTGSQTVSGDIDVVGNVSIGGTLTYQDVTNVDSVGIATARTGLHVLAGGIVVNAGVATFTHAIDANGGVDVAGVSTIANLKVGSVTVTHIRDEDNMASNSDTSLATQQSIKAYVDTQITAQDLDVAGDSGTGAVDLDSQSLTIAGTASEIETSASGQTITIGLPNDVTVGAALTVTGALKIGASATVGVTTVLDEDNMASNSATALVTQQSVKAYVDSTVTAQDLDFQADTGGALNIDLDSEVLSVVGTANEIETAGSGNQIQIGLPNDVTVGAALTVTGALDVNSTSDFANNVNLSGGSLNISAGALHVGTGATISNNGEAIFVGLTTFVGIVTMKSSAYIDNKLYVGGIEIIGQPGVGLGTDIVTRNLKATGISTFEGDTSIGIGGTTFVADVSVSRVGINSTAPAYTLDVDGVINSSTDVRINGVSVSGGISADDATALAIALG